MSWVGKRTVSFIFRIWGKAIQLFGVGEKSLLRERSFHITWDSIPSVLHAFVIHDSRSHLGKKEVNRFYNSLESVSERKGEEKTGFEGKRESRITGGFDVDLFECSGGANFIL